MRRGSACHLLPSQSLDADAGRTRREQNQIKIRKQKRDEQRSKRRQISAAAPPVPGMGGAPPTLEEQQQAQQAEALQRMAQDPQAVRQLLLNMTSQDDNLRLSATSQIRKLLSIGKLQRGDFSPRVLTRFISTEISPPIQDVIDIGMVPVLVQFLSRSDAPRLQVSIATFLGYFSTSQIRTFPSLRLLGLSPTSVLVQAPKQTLSFMLVRFPRSSI
jgi:hypothetical protein